MPEPRTDLLRDRSRPQGSGHAGSDPGPPAAGPLTEDGLVRVVLAPEVDTFNVALPRMSGSLHQSGRASGPNEVVVRDHGILQVGHITMGYPMLGAVDVADDALVAALVLDTPEGARWDGTDLRRGTVAVYQGGGHHQATDLAGMRVGFVVVSDEACLEAADVLGRTLTRPSAGFMAPDDAATLMSVFEQTAFGEDPAPLLAALATLRSTATSAAGARRQDSRRIVRQAIDFVQETGSLLPSSMGLCRATAASERSLQMAFLEVHGTTPSRFFRRRALSMARSSLVSKPPSRSPVSRVAQDFGFAHVSRFASYYREQFGEQPSATLVRAGR